MGGESTFVCLDDGSVLVFADAGSSLSSMGENTPMSPI
jgi:hypothetical protein